MRRWRVPYEKLRERLWESQLPWNEQAEMAAVGAVMMAPSDEAKRLVRRAHMSHFYLSPLGWIWDELATALWKIKVDWNNGKAQWVDRSEVGRRFKEKYGERFVLVAYDCLEACTWPCRDSYIDKVLEAAKVRGRIITAAGNLQMALDVGDEWRMKQ